MLSRSLFFGMCLLLAACATTSKDSMSSKEKAVLNLELGARYMELGMLNVAKEKLERANQLDSNNADIYIIRLPC